MVCTWWGSFSLKRLSTESGNQKKKEAISFRPQLLHIISTLVTSSPGLFSLSTPFSHLSPLYHGRVKRACWLDLAYVAPIPTKKEKEDWKTHSPLRPSHMIFFPSLLATSHLSHLSLPLSVSLPCLTWDTSVACAKFNSTNKANRAGVFSCNSPITALVVSRGWKWNILILPKYLFVCFFPAFGHFCSFFLIIYF